MKISHDILLNGNHSLMLILYAPTRQNGKTHSNNSSANLLSVFEVGA